MAAGAGKPKKCRPPVGLRTRFCVALESVLAPESNIHRAGVYVVQIMKLSMGKLRVAGVAARRGSKDRPVFFNACPFCRERIDFFKRKIKRT